MQISVGDTFGRWEVVGGPERRPYNRGTQNFWLARCSCGTERWVPNQTFPKSQSCGCLQREAARALRRTHGKTGSPLHKLWKSMRTRCYSPNSSSFHNYGGRGIKVSDAWSDFSEFEAWALRTGWRPGLDIGRIDNDGDYGPENCRWETRSQNLRNTRRTRYVEAFGERKAMRDWADDPRCAVSYKALEGRLGLGWDPERAITTPSARGDY